MSIDSLPTVTMHFLPPEILHLIAFYIPIQVRPCTLLALALTDSRLYTSVIPLLYAQLILRTAPSSQAMLSRLLEDKDLGMMVKELHIMTCLYSLLTFSEKGKLDESTLLRKLHAVIMLERLPNLHILGLVLLPGWFVMEDNVDMNGNDQLPRQFWVDLRLKCPRLSGVFVQGIGDNGSDPWLDYSGLYDLDEISHLGALSIKFRYGSPRPEGNFEKFTRNLFKLGSSLHTLSLCLGQTYEDIAPLFSFTFPHLRSLELGAVFLDQNVTAQFWARHPMIERILLSDISGRAFSDAPDMSGLLPNLTHLKANYCDIRQMIGHLRQLVYLGINNSINGQIPYLLRVLCPSDLRDLKSLEIQQQPEAKNHLRSVEGAMWYETKDGVFRQEQRISKAYRTMADNYMHSIVRSAPNIEELCLHGDHLNEYMMNGLASTFAQLPKLRRLYYRAFHRSKDVLHQSDIDDFLTDCIPLANACSLLETVTNIGLTSLPYLTAKIIRNEQGLVGMIVPGRSCGMYHSGGYDNPFPLNYQTL